jgi:uncharacterized protein
MQTVQGEPPVDISLGSRDRPAAFRLGDAMNIDDKTQLELEAAVFRRLVEHLRKRTDVQNLDLMNLAGFCRNCLSNWYEDAARDRGLAVAREDARARVYGMSYDEWKAKYQREATSEQTKTFAQTHKH